MHCEGEKARGKKFKVTYAVAVWSLELIAGGFVYLHFTSWYWEIYDPWRMAFFFFLRKRIYVLIWFTVDKGNWDETEI